MKKLCLKIILAAALVLASIWAVNDWTAETVLRIYDYETKRIYVEVPAKEGDELFFGWLHSWEKIPWHEYYHIAKNGDLILDTISFTGFGAGIPENKGKKVWTEKGMIFMGDIGQVFHEFTWINSHLATREIRLNGFLITCGQILPEHTRLNLVIAKKRRFFDERRKP